MGRKESGSEPILEKTIQGEIYSAERLDEYAAYLATRLKIGTTPRAGRPLLSRMQNNGKTLLACYRALTQAIHRKDAIPPAGEWLTDNFHIVEDQLREIREDLPPAYYNELPKLEGGELTGYPRIYAIALALVAHTDSQLELATIRGFVQGFQKQAPLKIGELWAVAITLRLVLVENLRRIASRIVLDLEKRRLANEFADRIFEAVGDATRFEAALLELPSYAAHPIPDDCAFTAQLSKRLKDQEPELWPALEALERHLAKANSSTDEVVHRSHQLQAANQVSVANVITSMRLLSSLNWKDFFESVSSVDRVLERDPVYERMDFQTRDRYRHVVERVAKKTGASETAVAARAIEFALEARALAPADGKSTHVGYYLIGPGASTLERAFGWRGGPRLSGFLLSHPYGVYFGLMALFLGAACVPPLLYAADQRATGLAIALIGLLIVIPCSDLALGIEHLILTHVIRPKNLPKLDLKAGIPEAARTMVVMPCMLTGLGEIRQLLEKLEIHFLGNSDDQLFFALITDFRDAASESLSEDASLLAAAAAGVARLNRKYPRHAEKGGERFFLFHRRRQWNACEGVWMGWERKRGKLHEFNRLLRGANDTSFSVATAGAALLSSVRLVITLDADTQLPRDAARRLVGAALHPLNEPRFDEATGRVIDGYGVLQPRIGISLESYNRSFFSKTFSDYTGIDPYTTAVSEVYQDLFHEGSYTGKGLYHVDAFEASLRGRVPENAILSHDLFEGLYSRAGLLTDVELLDDFPPGYHAYFVRQHRWTRGDWQIGKWVLPFVRDARGAWVRNTLPLISRWKILDNLRRSLVAPLLFTWLCLAWAALPGTPLFWAAYALLVVAFPVLVHSTLGALSFRTRSWAKIRANLWQSLLYLVFLAHQACIQADAIARALFRSAVTGKRLLEWTAAAQVESRETRAKAPLWQTAWFAEGLLAGLAAGAIAVRAPGLPVALALVAVWMSYPIVAALTQRPLARGRRALSPDDRLLMRRVARCTWQYFDTFVTAEQNWLPPDNHQEAPKPVTATRTSPTNIGLYLLSLVSARDLGYVSASQFVERVGLTLATLKKLERHEGHLLNWYDTRTLAPLQPKYVSTVDSGNFAAYLLAARRACLEIRDAAIVDAALLAGLADALAAYAPQFRDCDTLLASAPPADLPGWVALLREIERCLETGANREARLQAPRVAELRSEIEAIAPWVKDGFFGQAPRSSAWEKLLPSLNRNGSYAALTELYDSAMGLAQGQPELLAALQGGRARVDLMMGQAAAAAEFMDRCFREMNFAFLMNPDREVFSIGYNVTEGKFDAGLFDLLGSESRLASFVAIAKGDVPQEHWFRLGRQLVPISGGRALVSWTASMFEYLMPLLVLRDYPNTLLDETARAVVRRQIDYGRERQVPWGISEAAYNARDLQLNYQYGPFGIPGLGLKRGLSHDLVISPYSTLLAAMVNPVAAVKNVRTLMGRKLLTDYGFYESIDFTRDRLPENEPFAVIESFMAHHQGMSLVAINNVVSRNIVQNRFHADPRVAATHLLLQERVPHGVVAQPPKAAEIELEGHPQAASIALVRKYDNPNLSSPRIQLLSNRRYSVMISTAGAGYSKCDGISVTRWREDATRDHWGSYIFVKEAAQGAAWSATYQPFGALPQAYQVTFGEEMVEFRRRDGDISTHTRVLVAPEDNIEIRHVTLTNHSDEAKTLELTSYSEPVLTRASVDSDHPAFSKLFIQTEYVAPKKALLARRRRREAEDPEPWGVHVVVTDSEGDSDVHYETDRNRFIGRGRSLKNPAAMSAGGRLTDTCGATLDPILSLRVSVRVPPRGKIHAAFATGMASSREEALVLTDRYHDIHAFDREYKLAWTESQVDLRHLSIDADAAYLYQRVAERVLYSEPSLRPPTHQRAANTNVQSSLWPSGISGDLPIVVVRIRDPGGIPVVRQMLRCQEYLRLKGLVYDFVILNEHEATYVQDLHDELQQQVRSTGSQGWLNKPGGIFVLRGAITPEKDIAHMLAVARIALNADEPLKEQIRRKSLGEVYPRPLSPTSRPRRDVPVEAPAQNLSFYNGLGGFSEDGREYVIALAPGQTTPAPWLNVIGNRQGFGFQVSESGSGFTWSGNSQANRLTPWSNDPVCDPSGEIIYLRDEETGEVWTATPWPIRGDARYLVRHGLGYTVFEHCSHGIQHSLTLFVPENEPIKVSILKLKNLTGRARKLSVTSYTEWVLGSSREKTAPYLVCDVDRASGAIFARNPHDEDFAPKIAFADLSGDRRTFTCSRKEFIGRNGDYESPEALGRAGLSRKRGTGQDPCAAIQTPVELRAGEESELALLLGECDDADAARALTFKYRDPAVAKASLAEVVEGWNRLTQTVQVKTPDPAMNILMNQWLLYQTLSCRFWARTAFYQSGGAYGFRDQLQDCMAFVYAAPELTRGHILRASGRQFVEGDVQHWWHPPTGRGVRTRMSDDLLWLPYVVAFYVKTTGDRGVLNERVAFLDAPALKADESDSYTLPVESKGSASVFEHCVRALDRSLALGAHGLPLIGTGDWNDGMNRVGARGKGESVWLGWFLYKALADFLVLCEGPELAPLRSKYEAHMAALKAALEKAGWDGEWYRRAYFDDGTPLGTSSAEECRIDSIAQSWAVLSRAGERARAKSALAKVQELLVRKRSRLVLLLAPPFDTSPAEPGYIKGYVPGVRENGGQYTHAATWVVQAFADLGEGDQAHELFDLLNPIQRAKSASEAAVYRLEPYVVAGDVYAGAPHEGRGGWSWYTGAASWMYRVGLESLLGFRLRGDRLTLAPCIPRAWPGFEVIYRFGKSKYVIEVRNETKKNAPASGNRVELDGRAQTGTEIALVDDGAVHRVLVNLGESPSVGASRYSERPAL